MKTKLIPVKDDPDLARVGESGIVVNQNQEGYVQFIENRQRVIEDRKTIDRLQNDIDQLKDLVGKLLERNS